MFKNYFLTAIRNFKRNKLFSAINVFGLSIGLAACLIIGLYIHHELSYDQFNTNADRIVRATMEYRMAGDVSPVATTGTKVGPQFNRIFPEVENYVRTYMANRLVKHGNETFEEPRVLYADPAFFKMFTFPLIKGDAATALDAPDKVVITKATARKYFGESNPMNQTLTIGNKEMRVSGVCENVPANSQIKFDFVNQFLNLNGVQKETWWTANWITYLLLKDKHDVAPLQKKIDAYMQTAAVRADAGVKGNDYLHFNIQPLTRVHLHSDLAGFEPNGSITYIYFFAAVALLILIIACANYINLATAQSVKRTGEIGMRKVMGASGRQVFAQFMTEAASITLLSAAIAILLCFLALPLFNRITGMGFSMSSVLKPVPVLSLILFSMLIGFLAGLYPALILARTQTMKVVKAGFASTSQNPWLRKVLIVAQFAASVFLIISTIVIVQQMYFMKTKDLGYNKDHIIVLPVYKSMMPEFQNIKEAFEGVQGVTSLTASYETPEFVEWGDGITTVDEKGKHEVSVTGMPVDLDYIKTMDMHLLAGRDFIQSDFAMMDTNDNYKNYHVPYIINETLAKKLGWTPRQAIGKTIEKAAAGPVVGVVKDFNFTSLHDPIGPLLIFLSRDFANVFMLRINGKDMQATVDRIAGVWKQRVPDKPFTYNFLDDAYNKLYASEQQSSQLLSIGSALAIVLACLGLFGLAAISTIQRIKEIGIRRVLGAGVANIVWTISKNFLLLIMIAIAIALPLAYWATNNWLQDYSFRISVQPWVLAAVSLITVFIALVTIGYHSVRVSLLNPSKSLRTE